MRVTWAVLARYAEGQGGLVTIVSAPLDIFAVPELPAPIQFFLVAHLRFREDEEGGATTAGAGP